MHYIGSPLSQWSNDDAEDSFERFVFPATRWLLANKCGEYFSAEDAEEIAIDALQQMNCKWDASKGTPGTLYWCIVKRGAIDRMRRNRNRLTVQGGAARAITHKGTRYKSVKGYGDRHDAELHKLLRASVEKLPRRMKLAIKARAAADSPVGWAVALSEREGRTPHYWRKAYDDGLKKLRFMFGEGGVDISIKGDSRETATG